MEAESRLNASRRQSSLEARIKFTQETGTEAEYKQGEVVGGELL